MGKMQNNSRNKLAVKPSVPKDEKSWTITCTHCSEMKTADNFYVDKKSNIGRLTMCKDCIKTLSYSGEEFNLDSFIKTLKKINKPYIYKTMQQVLQSDKEPVGNYFVHISKGDKALMSYDESDLSGYKVEENLMPKETAEFEISDQIIEKWGDGFDFEEYRDFEKKHRELAPSYPEKTAFHTEKLKEYIRFQVKGEIALAKNEMVNAKAWFEEARKSADAAKINPKQMTEADLGGKNSFSEWFREVEKFDELTSALPKYIFKPKDSIDFTIWCYINYVRRLEGLGDVSYEEVYKFYDEMIDSFVKEYGETFFKGNPTLSNRDKISDWITIREQEDNDSEEEVL